MRSPSYRARCRSDCGRFAEPVRADARRLSLPVALLLALMCGALPARSLAASEGGLLDIRVSVGFTDTFRLGHWTPVNVSVSNRGNDVAGTVEVRVTGGDALRGRLHTSTYRRPLDLTRDSRKSFQFTVLLESLSRPLAVQVRANGRALAEREVDLRRRFAPERLVLVLSRDAQLDYLNEAGETGIRVLYPHPQRLPDRWQGYDAVSMVVLNGVSLEQLTLRQHQALRRWLAQGGTLAVSGGPDYSLLRTPRLAALMPGRPVGMVEVADVRTLAARYGTPVDVSRPFRVNRLGEVTGRVVLRAGSVPLLLERREGLGRVLYMTFDIARYPFDRWPGMQPLWSALLPPSRAQSAPGEAPPVDGDEPVRALVGSDATGFPDNVTLFAFLALYLGTLIAGHRIRARSRLTRWLAPAWSWASPVVFAPAAYLLFGPLLFPAGETAVMVSVIEPFPDSEYALLDVDVGVYSTRATALRMHYDGALPAFRPRPAAERLGRAGDWTFEDGPRVALGPDDPRPYVLSVRWGRDVIPFALQASLDVSPRAARLRFANDSGRVLNDLWLVVDGVGYGLGRVQAGARLERELRRDTDGIQLEGDAWLRLLREPSAGGSRALQATQVVLERRLGEAGAGGYPGPGAALLIGYSSGVMRLTGDSAVWRRSERTLVLFRFEVTRTAGAEDYGADDEG